MPFKYIPPSWDEGQDILSNPIVTDALHKEAEQRLKEAKQLAQRAGLTEFEAALDVQDGVRPKGRTYSYVIADIETGEAVEFGDTDTARRRILGQVQSGQPGTEE